MKRFNEVPDTSNMFRVCDNRHIIGSTDKAVLVRIGQTLYGEPITTFYPKSMIQVRYKESGGYEVFVPKWLNRNRRCTVGDFFSNASEFDALPF